VTLIPLPHFPALRNNSVNRRFRSFNFSAFPQGETRADQTQAKRINFFGVRFLEPGQKNRSVVLRYSSGPMRQEAGSFRTIAVNKRDYLSTY
jgi:hypothetical protein